MIVIYKKTDETKVFVIHEDWQQNQLSSSYDSNVFGAVKLSPRKLEIHKEFDKSSGTEVSLDG